MLSPRLSRSLLLLTTVSAHARIRQCVDVHLCVGMVLSCLVLLLANTPMESNGQGGHSA